MKVCENLCLYVMGKRLVDWNDGVLPGDLFARNGWVMVPVSVINYLIQQRVVKQFDG